jgi:hypothetical protein
LIAVNQKRRAGGRDDPNSPKRSPAFLSGSSSKSRLTCEHLQTPSEIFSDLDWQKQFDGALVRTGVGLDTNSDRKAYTALGPICVSAGFLGRGPEKPGYTLSPLTFNVWWRLEQLEILASRRCMMAESLNLVVEQDQAGLWRVTSPNIPGLVATGHSRREALSNVDGAISHLQRVERFAGIVTDDALRYGA